jgi:two-component system sensor histidine kinase AgrC
MRPTIKKVVIGIFIIIAPSILCYLFIFKWLGWLYFFISLAGIIYAYTKERRIFLDVPILAIASSISENLSQVIRFTIFIEQDLPVVLVTAGLFLLFFTFFTYLYRLFIKKVWHRIFMPVISQFILITIACMTVGILYINLFMSLNENLYYLAMFNLMIEVVYFLLMFVLSVILLRNVKKENMLKQKETEQQQLHHYMESLEQINKDMQRFRHDYKNILTTMQGYLNENNVEGLKTYFNDHIVKVEERTFKSNYLFNQLDQLKLVELKGLLATKILMAEELDIAINIEVPDVIEAIDINIIDLTRIIGIIIDNAIEASTEIEERQLNMALLKRKDDSVLIIVENRANTNAINMNHIFEADYSTKDAHSGMGLTTVRKILNDYSNITMNTRIENDFFIHELDIHASDSPHSPSVLYKTNLQSVEVE